MHDNAHGHTSKKDKYFLADNRVKTMDWQAQSSNLNPLQNIWKIIGDRARTLKPKN